MHSSVSENSLLESGWTLFQSGVSIGEKLWSCCVGCLSMLYRVTLLSLWVTSVLTLGNDRETWRDMTRRNGLLVRFQVPSPETCAVNDPRPFPHIGSCDKKHDQ